MIKPDARFKGEFEAKGNVMLEGCGEGQISVTGDLFIGEKGRVKGNVNAHNVIVAGKVEGDVQARGRIEIMTTGSIQGDVIAETLVVDEGGILQGRSTMKSSKQLMESNSDPAKKREKGS